MYCMHKFAYNQFQLFVLQGAKLELKNKQTEKTTQNSWNKINLRVYFDMRVFTK